MNPLITITSPLQNNSLGNNELGGFDAVTAETNSATDFLTQLMSVLPVTTGTGGNKLPLSSDSSNLDTELALDQESLTLLPLSGEPALPDTLLRPTLYSMSDLGPQTEVLNPLQTDLVTDDDNQSDDNLLINVLNLADNSLKTGTSETNAAQVALTKETLADESLNKLSNSELLSQLLVPKQKLSEVELNQTINANLVDVTTQQTPDTLLNSDKTSPNLSLVNQATPAMTKTDSVVTLPQVDVPLNKAGWGQAVGERLMMMVNDKVQSAQIMLNPPELGPIEVRVNLSKEQASVHFMSNHVTVRDAIEEAFPRLKEMFSQNGLNLSEANVSQQSPQQGHYQQHASQTDSNQDMTSDYVVDDTSEQPTRTVELGLVDQYV